MSAEVGHHQVNVLAKVEVAPDLDVVRHAGGRVVGEVGLVQVVDRLVLEPGLIGRLAAVGIGLVLRVVEVGGSVTVAVVGELVIIPGGDHREELVHLLHALVRADGAIELAVVVEALRRVVRRRPLAEGDRARDVGEDDAPIRRGGLEARVAGGLVDVVAEVNEEVDLLLRQQEVGVVVATDEVLTGHDSELHRHVSVLGRSGLGTANVGGEALFALHVDEAIIVGRRRREAGDLDLGAVIVLGERGHLGLRRAEVQHLREGLVGGDLDLEIDVGGRLIGILDASPEDDAVGARIAGGDGLREERAAVFGGARVRAPIRGQGRAVVAAPRDEEGAGSEYGGSEEVSTS